MSVPMHTVNITTTDRSVTVAMISEDGKSMSATWRKHGSVWNCDRAEEDLMNEAVRCFGEKASLAMLDAHGDIATAAIKAAERLQITGTMK